MVGRQRRLVVVRAIPGRNPSYNWRSVSSVDVQRTFTHQIGPPGHPLRDRGLAATMDGLTGRACGFDSDRRSRIQMDRK